MLSTVTVHKRARIMKAGGKFAQILCALIQLFQHSQARAIFTEVQEQRRNSGIGVVVCKYSCFHSLTTLNTRVIARVLGYNLLSAGLRYEFHKTHTSHCGPIAPRE